MAEMYGRLQGKSGEVTRLGKHNMSATLETWTGAVRLEMDKDGNYRVLVGGKEKQEKVIAKGKV